MVTWEYKLVRFDLMANKGYVGVEAELGELGALGWEFAEVQTVGDYPYAILKRRSG